MRKMHIHNCFECPNYDHSGVFTPGGAIPLCNAVKSRSYNKRRELPFKYNDSGKRAAIGEIPDWCPLPE